MDALSKKSVGINILKGSTMQRKKRLVLVLEWKLIKRKNKNFKKKRKGADRIIW